MEVITKGRAVFTLVCWAMVLVGACAPAAPNSPSPTVAGDAERELLALEQQWYDAYLRGDVAALERIEAGDFLLVTGDDSVPGTKAQQLQNIGNRTAETRQRLAAVRRRLSEPTIRVYGDAAVVHGISVEAAPGEPEDRALYTGVWVRRDGRWQIVNAQWTELPGVRP